MNKVRKFLARVIFGKDVIEYDKFIEKYNKVLENEQKLVDINRGISKHYDELIVKYDKLVKDYDHALNREYDLINIAKSVNESCLQTTEISNKIIDSLYEYAESMCDDKKEATKKTTRKTSTRIRKEVSKKDD